MPSSLEVVNRYHDAIAYIDRAIDVVDNSGAWIDREFANPHKIEVPRYEVAQLKARWLRSTSDSERAAVARDAELLADRVQESLPGAPQDRKRTNLFKGEVAKGTPATTYAAELGHRAVAAWDWFKREAKQASTPASLLLWGGALAVGYVAASAIMGRREDD
jgi:hypothetical protein